MPSADGPDRLRFENYDAIGAWRDSDGGFPVDPSGDAARAARRSRGPAELKAILRGKRTSSVVDSPKRCSPTPWAAAWTTTIGVPWTRSSRRCGKDEYRFSVLLIGGHQERSLPDAHGNRGRTMSNGGRISRRTVLRGLGTMVAPPLPGRDAALDAVGRDRRGRAAPTAGASSTCPTASSCPTGFPRRKARTSAASDPGAARRAPARGAGAQRPDLRQGPRQRRRRRRPCPRLVRVPDRRPGAKTAGANFRAGISADQAAAQRLGDQTRLPSLELGDRSLPGHGAIAIAATHAYMSTQSRGGRPPSPLPTEVDPKLVFDRLFSERPNDPDRLKREPAPVQRPRHGAGRRPRARAPAGRVRSPEARRVLDLRPRTGTADRPRRDPAAGPAPRRRGPAPTAVRPTSPSISG